MVDPQTAHDVLLTAHVVAGTTGLVLGPVAMALPKRPTRHPRVGLAYQAAVAILTLSALGLASLRASELWWLAVIALLTETAALVGWWARHRRFSGWLAWHVRLMCGSYVSLVTALLVVNWSSPLAWILPTIIGAPLIARASARASAGDRPRTSASARATGSPPEQTEAGQALSS